MTTSTRRKLVLVILGVLIACGGWLWARSTTNDPASTVLPCALASLPPEAADTVRLIHSRGPFPFPRNDGDVFGNREGHLPAQRKGYYHEYTVITPGDRDRSVRRIVTGGEPLTNPAQYFYTDDHYDSFCQISGAQR